MNLKCNKERTGTTDGIVDCNINTVNRDADGNGYDNDMDVAMDVEE